MRSSNRHPYSTYRSALNRFCEFDTDRIAALLWNDIGIPFRGIDRLGRARRYAHPQVEFRQQLERCKTNNTCANGAREPLASRSSVCHQSRVRIILMGQRVQQRLLCPCQQQLTGGRSGCKLSRNTSMFTKSPTVRADRGQLRPNTGVMSRVFLSGVASEQDLAARSGRRHTTSCPRSAQTACRRQSQVLVDVECMPGMSALVDRGLPGRSYSMS